MAGERVVFTDELTPNHHVRVIVSGPVDEDMLGSLEDYVNRQKLRLRRQAKDEPEDQPTKEILDTMTEKD